MVPAEKRAARRICCTFLLTEGAELDRFLAKVRGVEGVPEDEIEVLFAVYERLRAVYPRTSGEDGFCGLGSVLFDGERIWVADREAGWLSDGYADLAAMANLLDANEAEECAYLRAYFGAVPDAYQLARFFLMRQLVHIFDAMVFLCLGSFDGRVHLDRVIEGAWSVRFGEALRVVAGMTDGTANATTKATADSPGE